MAKINIYPAGADYGFPQTDYSPVDLVAHSKSNAKYVAQNDTFEMVLKGKNFVMDGDKLVAGTITEVKFIDADGDLMSTTKDIALKAKHLTYTEAGDPSSGYLVYDVMAGKDVITGSVKGDYLDGMDGNDRIFGGKGHDAIYGRTGNDTMTGGPGSDSFAVGHLQDKTYGKDVITDFDPDSEMLLVGFNDIETYELRRKGHDTLVYWDKDTSVLLMGVKPNQIHADNFDFDV